MNAHTDTRFQWGWLAALGVFILAAATGALLRFGLLHGFPAGLQYINVRHAHSHLMYFGWVTPALMALIATRLPAFTGAPISRRFHWAIALTLGAGLLAYLPFLLYGYRPAQLGDLSLPLSTMAAGLNVLSWYGFIWLYRRETRALPRSLPLQLWDGATLFLVLASLGAWGLPLLNVFGIESQFWSIAMTHIFLDLFADGWLVLALLGLVYSAHPAAAKAPLARRSNDLIVMGLPVVFLLGMPVNVVPPGVRWVASAGGLLVTLGLLGNVWALWRHVDGAWKVPLGFLVLKAITQLGILVPPAARWVAQSGLRIPYLHWLLLGFVSLGLLAVVRDAWGKQMVPGRGWVTAAVLLLILTLFPLTTLWPTSLGGRWTVQAAAWATLGPILAMSGMMLAILIRHRQPTDAIPA